MFGSFISYIFGVSKPSSYCILVGFLCGYPLGAKTVADFVRDGLISQEEAAICCLSVTTQALLLL